MEIIILPFALFLVPVSQFSFTLKAIKKLFIARTSDSTLLTRKEKKTLDVKKGKILKLDLPTNLKGTPFEIEISNYYPIKLAPRQIFKLFFDTQSCCKRKEKDQLEMLYKQGQDRLESEMRIE